MTIQNLDAAAPWATLLERYPLRECACGTRIVAYRESGVDSAVRNREAGANARTGSLASLPVILLHGIGSGAASWLQQIDALGARHRVLAWDAPGYGNSSPVLSVSPVAADYAAVCSAWLDALGIERCIVVGHSLGAIMAASLAAAQPSRVAGLLLLSPASGYGTADPQIRIAKRDNRIAMIDLLGPEGMAEQRSHNMLSAHAVESARDWVRWNMARVVPAGYRQATHLLANADLLADLACYRGPISVAVGSDDTITPPEACERVARSAGVELQRIPDAGHAGYVEAPQRYNAVIAEFCRVLEVQGIEAQGTEAQGVDA